MKKSAFLSLLFLLLAGKGFCSPNWTLTWSDEFNTAVNVAPNAANWGYDIGTGSGGWGNGELEYYSSRTNNARTDGVGNLIIEAKAESYLGSSYTSARILSKTKFSQLYGRFEARIKIPYGQGIWPAFWMLGNAGGWPTCGEIDIMENIGMEPNLVHGTIHGPGYSGASGVGSPYDFGSAVSAGYHIFAVEWEPGIIRWYFDNVLYETRTQADIGANTWVFTQPFYIILNVAVGGAWPGNPDGTTTFPQQMLVDYVRVYSRNTTQGAYKPLVIPGTIQAEDYDEGGPGVAYNDLTVLNLGNVTRTSEAVDLDTCTDAGGGYNLGWTNAGEWLEYTVNVAATGSYALDMRVAILGAGGTLHFLVDGAALAGSNFSIPDTGGWQTWVSLPAQTVALTAGTHLLRMTFDTAGGGGDVGNINWFRFTAIGTPTQTRSATPSVTLTASRTPTPTPSATLTATPTRSPTLTATVTFSPTISPTFTDVPPLSTLTPTPSHSPTSTASETASPTLTESPTLTHSPTETLTFTATYSFTESATLSPSPTVTLTQSPGPASTPQPLFGALEIQDSRPSLNPQPGPKICLSLRLSAPCDTLRVKIYSSATTLVWQGSLSVALAPGWSPISFDAPELASGLYFYRLEALRGSEKAQSKTGKLFILK